jgi:putative molybdopterin biosynthesis protein
LTSKPSSSDQRDVYLHDVPLATARQRLARALAELPDWPPRRTLRLPLDQALGHVTAAPVWATLSSPHFPAAAMDGVAVAAASTVGAAETSPRRLTLDTDAIWIDTGDAMPPNTDAVIMIEDLHDRGDGAIEITAAAAPWQYVRPMGEDIVASELVLPEGRRLEPRDLGALAAAGHAEVDVVDPPRVAVIPTGSELVPVGQTPKSGELIEFNGLMLGALAETWGAQALRDDIVADDFHAIRAATAAALEAADIVVINAGSSAGREDYSARVIADLGQVFVHGVAVRPGHPVVLGVARGKPVLGIPGYPVSAALTFELFVRPLIDECLGRPAPKRRTVKAITPRQLVSHSGDDEFIRVRVGRVGDCIVAAPLERAAGVIMSLVRADGLVTVPRFSEGIAAGSEVEVELLGEAEDIEHTAVAIGSHDPALDLLASEVSRRSTPMRLASTNAGSYGGLVALRRGEAHLAGCHLLDPATGVYNETDVQRVLPGRAVTLVNFAQREQGLIVPRGNPKGLRSLADLVQPGIRFVNRQRGAGTRMLLDHLLAAEGIDTAAIEGYDREQYTHLAVAADVDSGMADVALGIRAAARALGADFIPVGTEQYDLVIPSEHLEHPPVAALLATLRDPAFAEAVHAMGGYDTSHMGKVMAELGGDR